MKKPETYGEPGVDIGGFRIWINSRGIPEAADCWNANRVDATATCVDEEYPVEHRCDHSGSHAVA